MERWRFLLLCHLLHELCEPHHLFDDTQLFNQYRQSNVSLPSYRVVCPSSPFFPRLDSPTLMFTVLLSCRLVLNLRNTHANVAPSANSGNGPTPNNGNKNQTIPIHHIRHVSHDKTIPAKSEWIDISPGKSDLWDNSYPNRIAALNDTNQIV